jgi:antitoxin HicB
MEFVYPVKLARAQEGGFVVSARDLPEVVTQGEDEADALEQAEGALQAAIEVRIEREEEIPAPSKARRGEHTAAVPVTTALKASVYLAMRDQHVSKSELARRLGLNEKEARRMLDPHHATKTPTLERALQALGKHVEVRVV